MQLPALSLCTTLLLAASGAATPIHGQDDATQAPGAPRLTESEGQVVVQLDAATALTYSTRPFRLLSARVGETVLESAPSEASRFRIARGDAAGATATDWRPAQDAVEFEVDLFERGAGAASEQRRVVEAVSAVEVGGARGYRRAVHQHPRVDPRRGGPTSPPVIWFGPSALRGAAPARDLIVDHYGHSTVSAPGITYELRTLALPGGSTAWIFWSFHELMNQANNPGIDPRLEEVVLVAEPGSTLAIGDVLAALVEHPGDRRALLALYAPAPLRLPNYFGDGMVLQRDRPVRVWGHGQPGQMVEVGLGAARASGEVDANGAWSLELEPLTASFEERALWVECGAERRELAGVLVGDVWVTGGQSNMEWTLRGSRDADLEIPSADEPHVRFLRLPKVASTEPEDDFPAAGGAPWRRGVAPDVEHCSGVGYYFARALRRRLNVPIGLVDVSWGGTMAQHWVRPESLRAMPEMAPYLADFGARQEAWRAGGGEEGAARRLEADVAAWEVARAAAEAAGERAPRRPDAKAYADPARQAHPGGMLNAMIHPIARASVRGILFYQGENNSFGESWKPFHRTFPAVIADWRALFGAPDLPFGIIQIAGWSNRRTMSYDMNHHTNVVREIQFDTWRRTQNTGLIVTFDTNTNQSIHPAHKRAVGERSARWALAEVYGVQQYGAETPLEWRGPVYASSRVEGGRMVIAFEDGTQRGLRLDRDVDVGFYVAGEDRVFHHARAQVQGREGTLLVWSDDVPAPVAVRYGWSNLPAGGLMNARELPAYPFRTDDWPLTPHQSEGDYVRDAD